MEKPLFLWRLRSGSRSISVTEKVRLIWPLQKACCCIYNSVFPIYSCSHSHTNHTGPSCFFINPVFTLFPNFMNTNTNCKNHMDYIYQLFGIKLYIKGLLLGMHLRLSHRKPSEHWISWPLTWEAESHNDYQLCLDQRPGLNHYAQRVCMSCPLNSDPITLMKKFNFSNLVQPELYFS
jgi:hypothetical protein